MKVRMAPKQKGMYIDRWDMTQYTKLLEKISKTSSKSIINEVRAQAVEMRESINNKE
jgi:hypothetical protein